MAKDSNRKDLKGSNPDTNPKGGKLPDSVKDDSNAGKKSGKKGGSGKKNYRGKKGGRDQKDNKDCKPSNDAKWYYEDPKVAEIISQLSFQQLGDMPFHLSDDGNDVRVPSIAVLYTNPSPGVDKASTYSSGLPQRSGINMAGFKLYSLLAAYTGRSAVYGPQDLSTLILYTGEILSRFSELRRVFRVANTYSKENRALPKHLLRALGVDPDDFFAHFNEYRVGFNLEVTKFNKVPVPANVAYFEKCASMFDKVFKDSDSPMAQLIVRIAATTWRLDETSYVGGTVLRTASVHMDYQTGSMLGIQNFSVYLSQLSAMVDDLLNSSTFNVIYTDILNLARKMGNLSFWAVNFETELTPTLPEKDDLFLFQWHNSVGTSSPTFPTLDTSTGITPYNDVYPNASGNALFYNPAARAIGDALPPCSYDAILDTWTPNLDVDAKIDMTRWVALADPSKVIMDGTKKYYYDLVLPDHYYCRIQIFNNYNEQLSTQAFRVDASNFPALIAQVDKFDWHPIFRLYNLSTTPPKMEDYVLGDMDYFTSVDYDWLRRQHDFVAMSLYVARISATSTESKKQD